MVKIQFDMYFKIAMQGSRFIVGPALVENMAEENRSRFPIAVLLTTMLYNR